MPRIANVPDDQIDPYTRGVLESQKRKWGGPLLNHLLYARRPTIFRGVRGMWAGLHGSGLLEGPLVALLNRRVAFLNNCVF